LANLFVITGVLALVLGLSDLHDPRDFADVVFGLVWLAAAGNSVASAFAVFRAERWGEIPSLIAALSGTLMAGYILWVDSRSVSGEWWIFIVWIYLMLSIGAVVVVAWLTRLTPVKSWPVVIAVLVPFLGTIHLWYTTQYVPATELPVVNVTASLKEVMNERGVTALAGSISVQNNSKARIRVLGSVYRITATPIAQQPQVVNEAESYQVAAAFEWYYKNDRRFIRGKRQYRPDELVQADEVLPIDATFEPGQKWATTFVAEVDARKYGKVTLAAELRVLRLNQLVLSRATRCGHRGAHPPELINEDSNLPKAVVVGRHVCLERRIVSRNIVEGLVGDSPVFRNYLSLTSNDNDDNALGPSYPRLTVGLRGLYPEGFIGGVQDRLEKKYPLRTVSARTEIPLKPVKDFTG
jgi:hypothetical protein